MQNEILTNLWTQLLIEAPEVITALVGLSIASLFHRKVPSASLWVAGSFAITLVICAFNLFGAVAGTGFASYFAVPVLRAVTYGLLVVGVYAGRGDQTDSSSNPTPGIWQPLTDVLRARPGLKAIFISIFTIVFLVVSLLSVLRTFVVPEYYSSTARVRVHEKTTSSHDSSPSDMHPIAIDQRFLITECHLICSETVLLEAVQELRLNRIWGDRYNMGQNLNTAETIAMLLNRLNVTPVYGANVIRISFVDTSPRQAAEIANAVAMSYRSYRTSPQTQSRLSENVGVEIFSHAIPAAQPIAPDRSLAIVRGAWTGLWLGFITALAITWCAATFGKSYQRTRPLSGSSFSPLSHD